MKHDVFAWATLVASWAALVTTSPTRGKYEKTSSRNYGIVESLKAEIHGSFNNSVVPFRKYMTNHFCLLMAWIVSAASMLEDTFSERSLTHTQH